MGEEAIPSAAALLRSSSIAIAGSSLAARIIASTLETVGVERILDLGAAATFQSDDDLAAALDGVAFAIAVAPPESLLYRLNRVAMRTALRWSAGHCRNHAAVLGPTVEPGRTACYLCYQMRAVACSPDPTSAFARLQAPEDKAITVNTAAEGLLGHLLAQEAVNVVSGLAAASTGAIVTIDTITMTSQRDVVLRVPTCPVCGASPSAAPGARRLLPDLVNPRTGLILGLRDYPPPPGAPLPPYLSQAVLSNFDFRKAPAAERSAAGKGWTREQAEGGAIGEALERYCASTYDASALSFQAASGDSSYLEPSAFVLYQDRQYAAPEFPFRRYTPGQPLHWSRALRLDGTPVYVPASQTYLSFPAFARGENFSLLTTTGLSTGETLDAAILGGLYECIERDAFVLHWMNRLAAVEVALESPPKCEYVRAVFRQSGIDVRVFLLTTDIAVPVAMAITVDRSGRRPAAAVGLGCHLSGSIAVERAVLEVCQVYASECGRAVQGELSDPARGYEQVRTMEDHGGFFSIRERLNEFDHLLRGGARVDGSALPESASGEVSVDLARVAAMVETAGASVAFIDLTTRDLAGFPVRVVRTFAPGLQPIHFGFGWEALGGSRLYSIAARLGQDDKIRTEGDLNFCPHPLP